MTTDKPTPIVWLLTGGKMGDNAQLRALEARFGIEAVAKSLRYRASRLPNPLKGASLATLRQSASDPLEPPWPDLVIASGRRSVPVARWIKKQTGGRARLVQIGRPRAASEIFDLVITTPQYRLAPAANVIELPVPFTPLAGQQLAQEAARLDADWRDLPGPRIAVLVGGESSTSHIGPALGEKLGRDANRLTAGLGGSLMILSGRRTLPETVTALAGAVSVPHRIHQSAIGEDLDPYRGVLGLADAVIVTTDSASMIADGLATGNPVIIFDIPVHAKRPTDRWGDRFAASPLRAPVSRLADKGWISLPRRMDLLTAGLVQRGLTTPLDGVLAAGGGLPTPGPLDDLEAAWNDAVKRVAALLA